MAVSDSQKDQIKKHLQDSGVRNFCPVCNKDAIWKRADFVSIPIANLEEKKINFEHGLLLVPIICKNCGYVRFYSAKDLGLF